jgi:signal transduction histidine kinase
VKSISRSHLEDTAWGELATYLEGQMDEERASTARILHDEIGGLLVAAKMDLGDLERTLTSQASELTAQAARAQRGLELALAAERRLAEALQPGLLIHVGIIAALRWHLATIPQPDGTAVHAMLPDEEVPMAVPRRNALYRAVQEAVSFVCTAGAQPVTVEVTTRSDWVTVRLSRVARPPFRALDPRLLAVRHRVLSLRGSLDITETHGTAQLVISAPVS